MAIHFYILEERNNIKVLYLHGRPTPHPIHEMLAKSIHADFYPIDNYMRWQDRDKGVLYRVISSFINAFKYPVKGYDVILVDNLHFAPVICKFFRPSSKRKYVVHLGSHTLYFMFAGKFSKAVNYIHRSILANYDALICEGAMGVKMAAKMRPDIREKIFKIFVGPTAERLMQLNSLNYNPHSKNILIIANGPGEFRAYYKGIDIMLKSCAKFLNNRSDYKLIILGDWNISLFQNILSPLSMDVQDRIRFIGTVKEHTQYAKYLQEALLLLHCSRGDAFPVSTIEAMAAGVPVLMSEWTGTKEIVEKIEAGLVSTFDIDQLAERLEWFINLSYESKMKISSQIKNAAIDYTAERSAIVYRQIIETIMSK